MPSGREETTKKRIPNTVIGIIAHVDAGKTTLSEALLYTAGAIRRQGSVDEGNTALDTDEVEKERGITIFSSEAHFYAGQRPFTLLDTPGHVDFSAETERTFRALDAAVLVISATDGIQAHTRTLFRLVSSYGLPLFLFVTKTDRVPGTEDKLLQELQGEFGDGCLRFDEEGPDPEKAAVISEKLLSEYLEKGSISDESLVREIRAGHLFPVYFGSGLKNTGTETFLGGLERFMPLTVWPDEFGARVFKVDTDAKNERVTHLKLTGGSLSSRDLVGDEKVTRIGIMNGDRFTPAERAEAGDLVAVYGLSKAKNGDGFGYEQDAGAPLLTPLLSYALILPKGTDPARLMPELKKLEEEDPLLSFDYQEYSGEIRVSLMGEVQAEVLLRKLKDRLNLTASLGEGSVRYYETPLTTAEGVGHYEPLRHYAEVHLVVEPLPRGSGIRYEILDDIPGLDKNYRNLVLQHLTEREHTGILTGSPITDVLITLVSGRAHLKHTEGGDFREATYRALKNALMYSGCLLLEPYYSFRIRVQAEKMSRTLTDIRQRFGSFAPPVYAGEWAIITGRAPVSTMNDYAKVLSSYTGGEGELSLMPDGLDICHNEEEVVARSDYVPGQNALDSPNSVFCSHGAGFYVPWDHVREYMHLPLMKDRGKSESYAVPAAGGGSGLKSKEVSAEELEALMMQEFGPIRRPQYGSNAAPVKSTANKSKSSGSSIFRDQFDFLIVDGYNVIFQWEELKALAKQDIAAAREALIQTLSEYAGYTKTETVLVFDGYRVPGNPGESSPRAGLMVVYTRERESADLYIQRFIRENGKKKAAVVTSDGMIQLFALKHGLLRISSAGFKQEIDETKKEIRALIEQHSEKGRTTIADSGELDGIDPEKFTS